DDNKTEEELEHFLQQQTAQTSQNSKQETNQNNNKGILDNIASSMSDSTDKLVSQLDKSTKPIQDTVVGVGQLFSKVKDKVSGSDDVQEESETLSSGNKNNNNSNDDDEWEGGDTASSDKNFKKLSEEQLKRNGIDPHDFKPQYVFDNPSHYDIYRNTKTGEVLIIRKKGVGETIRTGVFIK
ncbi:MAG: hypothetical protein LBJ88_06500, partial [Campylobacteraceae bacterium]|nr:hypothetical protein [Campylobacteraceae bacterium]